MISQPITPVSQTQSDLWWFPVRITATSGNGRIFQEVWATTGGVIADREGGRVNAADDLAYPIDGGTYGVTAAGSPVEVFARRAEGIAGVGWELKGFENGGLDADQNDDLAAYTILTSGAYVDTGNSITLPSSGTYFLFCTLTAGGTISALTTTAGTVLGRLYDSTLGTEVFGAATVLASVNVVNVYSMGSGTMTAVYTVSGPTTISILAARSLGVTWTVAEINNVGGTDPVLGYVKLS